MAVSLAPTPRQWFGPAFAGYKVFAYAAGTLTKQNTFTDSTGTTPNTNPIVLDANGSAAVFFTPGSLYKEVLALPTDTDPPTTPIFIVDNIGSTTGGILNTIASLRAVAASSASGSLSVLGYYAAGDGGGGLYWFNAADTTSADNGGTIIVAADLGRWYLIAPQWVSIKQFGCKMDAVTDDTTALQNAVTWATSTRTSLSSGWGLIVPPGFCLVSAAISVTGPLLMQGFGAGSGTGTGNSGGGVIRTSSTTADVFTCNTSQAVVFKDFTIDTTVVKSAGNGITITQTGANINRKSRIEGMNILKMFNGISLQNTANYTIRDNFIQDFITDGIYHTGTATSPDLGDSIIEGNTVWDLNTTNGDACIRLDPGAAVNIIGNKLLSANYGVRLTVSQGPTGTMLIMGNSMEQQNTACISGELTLAGKTYGNICIIGNELSVLTPVTTEIAAIRFPAAGGGQYLSNVTIANNVCNMGMSTTNPIISVQDGNGVTITGNTVNNNGITGATAGIDVGGNATNVVIDANKVINMGGGSTYTTAAALLMQPAGIMTFTSGSSTVGAGLTDYLGAADVETVIGTASFYVPFKCIAVRMFVNAGAAPGGGQSFQYTLMVNGSASALTVTNSGAGASDCQDITHAVQIIAPDGPNTAAKVALQIVTSGGAAVTNHRVTVQFVKND